MSGTFRCSAIACIALALPLACGGAHGPRGTAVATSPAKPSAAVTQTMVTGEGTPLVIMGGGIAGVKGWEGIADHLVKAHHQVVLGTHLAIQYGLEDRPLPDGYSITMEAEALLAALDRLGVGAQFDLIGHSSGGLIALVLALDHPDRIRTLTLSEPPAYFLLDAQEKAAPQVVEWATTLRRVSPQTDPTPDDVEAFMLQIGAVPPCKQARESPRFPMFLEHRRSMRGFQAILNLSIDPRRLDTFTKPVLLVRGIGTVPTHALINDQLKRHFARAKTIELEGGHNGVIASQHKFLDELDKFLGSAK